MSFDRVIREQEKLLDIIKQILPSSWSTRPMIEYLRNRERNSSLVGVEIGVDLGLNTKNILQQLPVEKMYLIDPYIDAMHSGSGDERYKTAQRRLAKYQVVWYRKKSEGAVNDVPDDLDFVYIDGDHTYAGVKKDLELWYPKVKKGGVVGGHDFWGNDPGVARAALEFTDKHGIELYGRLTDWWLVKE